jgi:2-oxoisovalerate dehydrogenase E1 component alpha subunit
MRNLQSCGMYRDQYASDGVAPRGLAFGLPTIRVDGNDFPAVFAATRRAREIAISEGKPTLIEAMTYRYELPYLVLRS